MQKYILLWLLLLRYMVGYSQDINLESRQLIRGVCPSCFTGFKLNIKKCKKVKKLSLPLDSISVIRYKDSIVIEGLEYFTHLEELDVRDRVGTVRFTKLPPRLKKLNCSNIGLSKLPPLPESLRELNCGGNELTQLPPLPKSLRELDCNGNRLTVLPPLPASLEVLNCVDNHNLKGIAREALQSSELLKPSEVRLPSIRRLYVDTFMYYYLKQALPDTIHLSIDGADMDIQLPPRLRSLHLSNYHEDKLPILPPTLRNLEIHSGYVRYQKHFKIDSLPPQLETIWLADYYRAVLPPLPPTLCVLMVETDSALPPLHEGLIQLYSNKLPPKLPQSLEYLTIVSNPSTIPLLHEGLKFLEIICESGSTPINIALPPLPSTIQTLYMGCVTPDTIQIPATAKLRAAGCTHCTESQLRQIPTAHLKKIYVPASTPCLPPSFEHVDRGTVPICK